MTKWWVAMALAALAMALVIFGLVRLIDRARAQVPERCVSIEQQKHIRKLTAEAIDAAFQSQVGHLFTVWLKDPTPEPTRAMAGMSNAISAYQRARANAEKWQPETCQ